MWLDTLKEMKKVCGKTAQQISNETGEPLSTINKLFSGSTKEPRLTLVMSVVHCMGFSLDDLSGKNVKTTILNDHEQKVINAYRNKVDMQNAVDTLLGIQSDSQGEVLQTTENKKRA